MNLPIPEFSEFVAGFATCGALMVASVAVRHAWPTIKGFFVKTETIVYAEYKAVVAALDKKIDALSNAAAGAINAVRGDVAGMQSSIAALEDRAFTLEKAVGIPDPTQAKPQAAPVNPTVQSVGAIDPAGSLHV